MSASLQKENEMLKQKISILQNHFKENKTIMECLKSDYEFKTAKYDATIVDLNRQIEYIQHSQIGGLHSQINELSKTNEQLLSEKRQHNKQIEKLNLKILQREHEINELRLQNAAANDILNEIQRKLNESNENLIDTNQRLDILTQEIQLKTTFNESNKSELLTKCKFNRTIRINNSVTSCLTLSISPPDPSSFETYDVTQPMLVKRHKSSTNLHYCFSPYAHTSMSASETLKNCPTNTRRYSTIPIGLDCDDIENNNQEDYS
eukprot:165951_1